MCILGCFLWFLTPLQLPGQSTWVSAIIERGINKGHTEPQVTANTCLCGKQMQKQHTCWWAEAKPIDTRPMLFSWLGPARPVEYSQNNSTSVGYTSGCSSSQMKHAENANETDKKRTNKCTHFFLPLYSDFTWHRWCSACWTYTLISSLKSLCLSYLGAHPPLAPLPYIIAIFIITEPALNTTLLEPLHFKCVQLWKEFFNSEDIEINAGGLSLTCSR